MKRQLQLVVALAVLGVAVLAGNAAAGGINLGSGSGSLSIDLPGGTQLDPLGDLPACANLKDDDGDGKADLLDPGCSGAGDDDETDPAAPPADDPTGDPTQPPADPGDDDGSSNGGGSGGHQGDTGYDPKPGQAGQGNGGGAGQRPRRL